MLNGIRLTVFKFAFTLWATWLATIFKSKHIYSGYVLISSMTYPRVKVSNIFVVKRPDSGKFSKANYVIIIFTLDWVTPKYALVLIITR